MNYLKLLLLFASLLFCNTSSAQTQTNAKDYSDFVKSYRQNINYPVELFRNCVSSFCILKIQVGPDKKIKDMSLSDSADSLLKFEFNGHKQTLNKGALELFIKNEFGNTVAEIFLIPISYSFHQMPCPPQTIKLESLYNYFKFDRKEVNGQVILLPAIGSLEHIQR